MKNANKKQEPLDYYGHPMFIEIAEELKWLHSEKNRQYASKSIPLGNFYRTGKTIEKFLKPGINPNLASLLFLVSKQIDAVYDIVAEGKTDTLESIEDKMRDVAVYFILAIIILRESKNGPK